tara:strand:- start:17 stop:1048 length:1032 start_codon:yes stop_codon:yes gene_type:complete
MNNQITIQPLFSYKKLFSSFIKKNTDSNKYLYNSGRSSLDVAIKCLLDNKYSVKQILLPDLICNDIIPILDSHNLIIKFYPVDEKLNPDLDYIENEAKNNFSIICIVNYFGSASNWNKILELKKTIDCIIIEDNAHSLYGEDNGINFGELGDISFNSLRKILPLLSGSELKINIKTLSNKYISSYRMPNISELATSLRSLKPKDFKFKNIHTSNNRYKNKVSSIDYFSKYILNNEEEYKNITCVTRQNNFKYWQSFLKNSDLEFIELKKSLCPYVMPCYANDEHSLNKWTKWSNKNSINIIRWPDLPIKHNHLLKHLKLRKIICFPVNQYYDLNKIPLTNDFS